MLNVATLPSARLPRIQEGWISWSCESESFRAVAEKLPRLARCQATILIHGELGSGRESLARAIHQRGPRRNQPFVAVSCGVLSADQVEQELFGGLQNNGLSQPGRLYEADGGTLFLDEVDTLPPRCQVKLLRFLQEREIQPRGSSRVRMADVRLIVATHTDLEAAVHAGRLRPDLYYRLGVLPVTLPPLRDRVEDILPLAHNFLKRYTARQGRGALVFSVEARRALLQHTWPGNVRELEQAIERAAILSTGGEISAENLSLGARRSVSEPESFKQAKARVVAQFETAYIKRLLIAYQGNISRAAAAAQKNRRAFFELIRKHEIDAASFRVREDCAPL